MMMMMIMIITVGTREGIRIAKILLEKSPNYTERLAEFYKLSWKHFGDPSPFIKFKHVKIKPNKMTVEQDNKIRKIH